MATSLSIRLEAELLRSLAFGSIGASYTGIGTSLESPVRIFHLQNLTDAELMFSFDGVDDHLVLPSNGYILLDVTANKTREDGCYLAEGTRIYVKQLGIPASGNIYLTTFSGAE